MMEAHYVDLPDRDALLAPDGQVWRSSSKQRVQLMGTPVGLQPTDAIRVSWTGKKIGAIERVEVRSLHDGRVLAFRLEWDDAREDRQIQDSTDFADAAALLFSAAPDAPIATMGEPGKPVNAWYWRADESEGRGRHVAAAGIGTSRTLDLELVRTRAVWKDGRWHVVIARPLRVETKEPVVQLEPGATTRFGVAVWEGSHAERGGIKAFSPAWQELRLAPASSGGR